MTISSTNNRNDYTGDGSTDTYSYTFKITSENDLKVFERDTDAVETELVLNTDFTVTGAGAAAGGTVVLTGGNLTSGHHLTIRRYSQLKQETDIRNQGDFFPEVHEDVFDHLMSVDQTQQNQLDRSVKVPETYPDLVVILPAPEAGKVIKWNEAGTALINVAPGSVVLAVPADDSITTAMYTAAAYPVLLVGAQTIAGVKTFTNTRVLSNAAPTERYIETDAAANNKIWETVVIGEQYRLRVINDALDTVGNIFTVDRTGTTVDNMDVKPPLILSSGITNSGDTTKRVDFDTSNLTTATTRTVTFPDADMEFDFGLYSAVATAGLNLDSTPANHSAQYIRVGDRVTVSSSALIVDPTASGARTTWTLTLPFASDLSSVADLGGGGSVQIGTTATDPVFITVDGTNDKVSFTCFPSGTSNSYVSYTYTYRII